MRNVAQIGRREVEFHRRSINGITAESPRYVVVDSSGHKEWVVDVYLGPLDHQQANVVRNVPIAPYARQLIGDVRQPVELERSKQGKYTVVGRAKVVPSGAQMPEGSILEPTYHEVQVNLAELGLLHVADLDYKLEGWGHKPWGEPWKPFQGIEVTDAFGAVVAGPEVDEEDEVPRFSLTPIRQTTTRHTIIRRIPWGEFLWGAVPWGAYEQKVVTLTE